HIHGEDVPVRASLHTVSGFSAHADWKETLRWMDGLESPPAQTLCVHGEPDALQAQAARLAAKGWPSAVPKHLERVELAVPGGARTVRAGAVPGRTPSSLCRARPCGLGMLRLERSATCSPARGSLPLVDCAGAESP